MHIDSLVRMANQIGAFFEAMPDRPEALQGIAQHLKRFWDPRMRVELLAHVDAGTTDLNAMVVEAVARHRGLLATTPMKPMKAAPIESSSATPSAPTS